MCKLGRRKQGETSPYNLPRIYQLLGEAQAAARTLYEVNPDPLRVEPLYRALQDAHTEIARELSKIP